MPYGTFFVAGLALGAIYALSGVGLVLLYRSTGVLNLAYGAIGAAGAMLCWQLVQWGSAIELGVFAAIVLATTLSVAYGRLIAPHLAYRDPVVKAVATLGLALIILGILNWIWPVNPRRLSLPTDTEGFPLLGVRVTLTRAIGFAVTVLATLSIAIVLGKTRIGLLMRALANNRGLASVLGVPVLRVETFAWAVSGLLAGFSGIMLGNLVRLDPSVLTFLVIPAIAAAIVGRLQSLIAALLGGIFIGVVEAMTTLIQPLAPVRSAAPFVVAAAIILWLQRKKTLTFANSD
ncbi:MAG: branched-chain amino acid ABC transporter permease [Burkholderiales bacterium]